MTFNVENLFDTVHDEGKLDYTFLPLAEKKKSKQAKDYCETLGAPKWKEECLYLDWSPSTLKQKMQNLADTVFQVEDGRGPDVLILEEVENIHVLREWVTKYLKKAGYSTVELVEGKDARGIDTAIVSRLRKIDEPILHLIPFEKMSESESLDTRGILELNLALPDGQTLVVYANHFPAPFHKREYRIDAYKFLGSLMKQKNADTLQVAGGDFNTPGDENIKYDMLKNYVSPFWIVAHQVGYHGNQGSSYYPKDKTWSFLDMILISKSFDTSKTWKFDPASFRVADQFRGQLNEAKTPQSFDPRTGAGVSDHLPLYIEITKQQ